MKTAHTKNVTQIEQRRSNCIQIWAKFDSCNQVIAPKSGLLFKKLLNAALIKSAVVIWCVHTVV